MTLIILLAYGGLFIESSNAFHFTALNCSLHALQLYKKLRNADVPSERDPAFSDPQVRRRICGEIVKSGFFHSRNFVAINMKKLFDKRDHPEYRDIFHMIYTAADPESNLYDYTNDYRPRRFGLFNLRNFEEYVFVCPFENPQRGYILPFYISKEYNVSPSTQWYKPGRFMFCTHRPNFPFPFVVLAEEPAEAYFKPNFNIERHYLQRRKFTNPAESYNIDPLCKLISQSGFGFEDQYYRLCTAISRSSYFKGRIRDTEHRIPHRCTMKEISFKTMEANNEALERSYYEWMTRCDFIYPHTVEGSFYLHISRAYLSDQVFVYLENPSDGKVYLENLSTNISVFDELNSLDFVED